MTEAGEEGTQRGKWSSWRGRSSDLQSARQPESPQSANKVFPGRSGEKRCPKHLETKKRWMTWRLAEYSREFHEARSLFKSPGGAYTAGNVFLSFLTKGFFSSQEKIIPIQEVPVLAPRGADPRQLGGRGLPWASSQARVFAKWPWQLLPPCAPRARAMSKRPHLRLALGPAGLRLAGDGASWLCF